MEVFSDNRPIMIRRMKPLKINPIIKPAFLRNHEDVLFLTAITGLGEATFLPQSLQKFAPAFISIPQFLQNILAYSLGGETTLAPHFEQNFELSSRSLPHLWQKAESSISFSAGASLRLSFS